MHWKMFCLQKCVPALHSLNTCSQPWLTGQRTARLYLTLQVIMATNRIESLDPALIRPGRIDRKIEFPLPDTKTKRRIFNIHTSKMTLAPDVNLEEFIMAKVIRH